MISHFSWRNLWNIAFNKKSLLLQLTLVKNKYIFFRQSLILMFPRCVKLTLNYSLTWSIKLVDTPNEIIFHKQINICVEMVSWWETWLLILPISWLTLIASNWFQYNFLYRTSLLQRPTVCAVQSQYFQCCTLLKTFSKVTHNSQSSGTLFSKYKTKHWNSWAVHEQIITLCSHKFK